MTLYAILGIPRNADEHTIRDAYRTLARRYHPDRGAGSSGDRFREVTEAYDTLMDPARRHSYDLSVRASEPAGPVVPQQLVRPWPSLPQEDPRVFGSFKHAGSSPLIRPLVKFNEWFESVSDGWHG